MDRKLIDYIKKTFKQQDEDYDSLTNTIGRIPTIKKSVELATDFLDHVYNNDRQYGVVNLTQRLWHVINDSYGLITSPSTRRPMVFKNITEGRYAYHSAPGQVHVQFISRLIFHKVSIKKKYEFVDRLSNIVEDILKVDGGNVTPQQVLFLLCIKDRNEIHQIVADIERISRNDFVTDDDYDPDDDELRNSDEQTGLLDKKTILQRKSLKDKIDDATKSFRIVYRTKDRGGEDIIEREVSKHIRDEDHNNLMTQIKTETLANLATYVSNSVWAESNLKPGKVFLVDTFADLCDSRSLAQLGNFAKNHNTIVADNRDSKRDQKVMREPLNYYTYLKNDRAFSKNTGSKTGRIPITGRWNRQEKSPSLSTLGDMLVSINPGDPKKTRSLVFQPNPNRSFLWKDIVSLYVNKKVTALEYVYLIKLMEHFMMKHNKELETASLVYGLIKGSGFDRKYAYKWDTEVEGYPKPSTDAEKMILKIILRNLKCHNHKAKNPRVNYKVYILEKGVVKKKDEKFIGVGYKDKGTAPDPTRQEAPPPYDDLEAEIMSQIIYMTEISNRWEDIVDALEA